MKRRRKGVTGRLNLKSHEPVQVLVGYFNSNQQGVAAGAGRWKPPRRPTNAAAWIRCSKMRRRFPSCPNVNVHAFRYDAGRQKLELIGKGSFVVLGVVPQSVQLDKRNAGKGIAK